MVTYRFKISFEDYDGVVREIDIKTSQTFKQLHDAIHQSTGYNAEKSSSFYISTDNWLKGDEIAYLPNERKQQRGVVLMEDARLKSFIDDPHQKFYYTYNFERPYDFHVELVKIILDANESLTYPVLVSSRGEAPKIFDKNSPLIIPTETKNTGSEFDFLNELNFVPEDAESLESMAGHGINEEEKDSDDESDEFSDDEEATDADFEESADEDY